MEERMIDGLVDEQKRLAEASEEARQAMLRAAEQRQEAIFALHAGGLSIRRVAERLGISNKVVQDAIAMARRRRPQLDRREDRVAWELHRAVADQLRADPAHVVKTARRNLERMRDRPRSQIAQSWLDEWDQLLNASEPEIRARMLATDERATDLRQMSPFAGALSQDQRTIAILKAGSAAR
ncbi:hypothetical protein V6N00_13570 [Tersicoccus sp. MR15.9]|uniref:hypothetical protein n=1 Tax=Tersicoccus mangrovi TaxID=3121635 RepID=UPI002FE5A492